MHKKFDHKTIEKKWQKRWRDEKVYEVANDHKGKKKRYILTEYPYPSGNLHIGHWYAFAVPDILVRAKRMQGEHVMYPVGFDSFGLPAENAAIKNKLDPKKWTYENIDRMTAQLESMGNSYDWSRAVRTSDPDYYRWTQWLFLQLFKNNLAYRGTSMVNWCPLCKTVLANEQVVGGKCERCGSEVEHREMPQWLLRITDYADRLIDDLDALNWPEPIKESQRNWIGRSEGINIDYTIVGSDEVLTCFTTTPVNFGASFIVIAPEHPLTAKLTTKENEETAKTYTEASAKKNEMERTGQKEKTGVFTGSYAINHVTGEHMPIWIADFVLKDVGTGAVQGCPGHDKRDFQFAKKYGISIRRVVVGPDNDTSDIVSEDQVVEKGTQGRMINSGFLDGVDFADAMEKTKDYFESKGWGKRVVRYKLRDWSVGRQRYWGCPIPIVYDPEGLPHAVPDEHLPWLLPEDVDFTPTGEPPLAKSEALKKRTVEIFGEGWTPEVETLDTFVDSSWYFLRYTDPKNTEVFATTEAQGAWMPIDAYFGGAEHTTMHLLYARFVQKVLCDMGLATVPEPFTVRVNRGLVLGPDGNKMSKSKGNVIDPDEQVSRLGADTVKIYLAFMGPYGEVTNYPWDMGGIAGTRRFLERVHGLGAHVHENEPRDVTSLLHRTVDKVTRDIEHFKFNTAISAMMIFINAAEKDGLSEESYKTFLKLLAPFAPHLAEELWETAGESFSIHQATWPLADKSLLTEETATIAVQINGKARGTIEVSADTEEESAMDIAKAHKHIAGYLDGKTITRVVYVPGKILNIIVR
ncbi:leucine--tRNA ligase [Candidatus Kaiserbacteria bacterium]|nr:leucine--tRNA ligase [Candidatus Kaiserbacteria bacterium]